MIQQSQIASAITSIVITTLWSLVYKVLLTETFLLLRFQRYVDWTDNFVCKRQGFLHEGDAREWTTPKAGPMGNLNVQVKGFHSQMCKIVVCKIMNVHAIELFIL